MVQRTVTGEARVGLAGEGMVGNSIMHRYRRHAATVSVWFAGEMEYASSYVSPLNIPRLSKWIAKLGDLAAACSSALQTE